MAIFNVLQPNTVILGKYLFSMRMHLQNSSSIKDKLVIMPEAYKPQSNLMEDRVIRIPTSLVPWIFCTSRIIKAGVNLEYLLWKFSTVWIRGFKFFAFVSFSRIAFVTSPIYRNKFSRCISDSIRSKLGPSIFFILLSRPKVFFSSDFNLDLFDCHEERLDKHSSSWHLCPHRLA